MRGDLLPESFQLRRACAEFKALEIELDAEVSYAAGGRLSLAGTELEPKLGANITEDFETCRCCDLGRAEDQIIVAIWGKDHTGQSQYSSLLTSSDA